MLKMSASYLKHFQFIGTSLSLSLQGPRSNFEIGGGGGGHISDSILGGHKILFLTNFL